jgi:hypothetical protein
LEEIDGGSRLVWSFARNGGKSPDFVWDAWFSEYHQQQPTTESLFGELYEAAVRAKARQMLGDRVGLSGYLGYEEEKSGVKGICNTFSVQTATSPTKSSSVGFFLRNY